ncbi:hypothetical protein BHM03_00041777, partial [Ensete ventricosum]
DGNNPNRWYRSVAGGPRFGQWVYQYVPPGTGGIADFGFKGEEIACQRRNCPWATYRAGKEDSRFFFSLFFFLLPSADISEIDR